VTPSLSIPHKTGKDGEKVAAAYLSRKGYQILATNWRNRTGEIDIICRNDNCLIFVEVKSSRDAESQFLHHQVNDHKREKIYTTAQDYLFQNEVSVDEMRFDVIFMTLMQHGEWKIEHVKDAFRV
jgi:putative endonuclease